MNEFNTFEYSVKQKSEGKFLRRKIFLIIFYTLYPIIMLSLGFIPNLQVLIAPMLAFIPISLWVIVFMTWRYVNIEYEYSITSGFLSFSKIYGSRSRKKFLEIPIKDFALCAPIDNREKYKRALLYKPEKEFSALPSSKINENSYFAIFELDKKHCIFLFEMTENTKKIIKFYNAPVFTDKHF